MIDHPKHPAPKRTPKRLPKDVRPTEIPTGIPTDIPGVFHKNRNLVVALLESASQGIISIDPAGRIVLANRRAGEMFGYTSQQLLGAPVELLLPESQRAGHG